MAAHGLRYFPILKWRQGEYQALLRISKDVKDVITPIIEIPDVEWDFEEQRRAKTLDQHLEKFVPRLKSKWGTKEALLDLHLVDKEQRMNDGAHPIRYLFEQARAEGLHLVPVITLGSDEDCRRSVRDALREDGRGICLRISAEEWSDADAGGAVLTFLRSVGASAEEVDLVLDLRAPSFTPFEGFSKFLSLIYPSLANSANWKSVVIAATAFPKTMAMLSEFATRVPRYEWLAYKGLLKSLPRHTRTPYFADYAIAHPDLTTVDMRIMKPSASIRYTIEDAWYLIKGANVRDHGFDQYKSHCSALLKSGEFLGANYSKGDKYISDCAVGRESTGNLTTWRWVGTTHHLTKVAADVASFAALP